VATSTTAVCGIQNSTAPTPSRPRSLSLLQPALVVSPIRGHVQVSEGPCGSECMQMSACQAHVRAQSSASSGVVHTSKFVLTSTTDQGCCYLITFSHVRKRVHTYTLLAHYMIEYSSSIYVHVAVEYTYIRRLEVKNRGPIGGSHG